MLTTYLCSWLPVVNFFLSEWNYPRRKEDQNLRREYRVGNMRLSGLEAA